MNRRLIAVVAVALAVALTAFLAVRSAVPRRIAEVRGRVISPPTGAGPWVAWIEGDDRECRLMVAGGDGKAALTAPQLSALAVSGEEAYVTRADGPQGELLRVPLSASLAGQAGRPETVARLQAPSVQMVAGEGWLCWREYRPPGLPDVPFVVAGAPTNVLRACLPGRGSQSQAKVWLVTPVSGGAELLGILQGRVYWLEHQGVGMSATSLVRRAALPAEASAEAGAPEVVAQEPGWRSAALASDHGAGTLYWTAPSVDAAEPGQFGSVKRLSLGAGGADQGAAEVIADWLDPRAVVMASASQVCAQDPYYLWRLGERREQQRALYEWPPGLVSSTVIGEQQYLVMQARDGAVIATRPLTGWGRFVRAFQW